MTPKSISDLKLWLLENEDYYKEIQPIISLHCENCLDQKRDKPCVRQIYKKEFKFAELFERTRVLPKYLETVGDIGKLLEVYNTINLEDPQEYRNWLMLITNFWEERYLCGDIEEMLVKNSNGDVIGFKIIYSKLFEENPYYVPVEGYESLLIFNNLYKKYIAETSITLPSELIYIENINLN